MKPLSFFLISCLLLSLGAPRSYAQLSAEEAAKKAQDPLADVKAIMTDNTVAYDTAGDTSYSFQFQPVYSLPLNDDDNLVLRGIIPVAGVVPGGPAAAVDRHLPLAAALRERFQIDLVASRLGRHVDDVAPIR